MEKYSLFDLVEEKKQAFELPKLEVVQMDFVTAKRMTWEELFEGFDDIKAITFSSGMDFTFRFLSKFKTAEVIFGCEDIISYKAQEIMAFQIKLIEKLQSKIPVKIFERIEDGSIVFYLERIPHHRILYVISWVILPLDMKVWWVIRLIKPVLRITSLKSKNGQNQNIVIL